MPLKIDDREFINVPVPKGTKARIRVFAAKNGYKGVAECVRAGIDMLIGRKCSLEAVAGQIKGIKGDDNV